MYVHTPRNAPHRDGEWEYVQERVPKESRATASANGADMDGLWEVNADLEDQEQIEATITVPLINGDAAAIRRLTAQESEKNLGLRVKPDGDCGTQLNVKKSKGKTRPHKSREATSQQEQSGKVICSNCGQASNTDWGRVWRYLKSWREVLGSLITTY